MIALEAREDKLNALLAKQPVSEPSLHPNLAEIYREKVAALHTALSDPRTNDEAFGIIRTLIDDVRLVPEDGQLRVELRGALAGILALTSAPNKNIRQCHQRSCCMMNLRPPSIRPSSIRFSISCVI